MPKIAGRPGLTPAGAAMTWTAAQAATFMDRCVRSHQLRVKVDCWRWSPDDAAPVRMLADIPIVRGTLRLDASNAYRRDLSLEVPGTLDLVPVSEADPLTPFGRWLAVHVAVDLGDGTWSPWLMLGEFAIQATVYERPSGILSVEAADWSVTVDAVQIETKRAFKAAAQNTVAKAVKALVDEALPKVYGTHTSPSANGSNARIDTFIAQPGQGRWTVCQTIGDKKGFEVLFNANGNLVIRKELTNEDLESGSFPAEDGAPDLGTKSNPTAILSEGEGGSLIALTGTVTREGGINRAVVRRVTTVTRKKKGQKAEQVEVVHVAAATITAGPVAWGDRFGRVNLVESDNVAKITDAVKAAARRRADGLLLRRGGLIRYLDLDAVPLWWVEPDDVIRLQFGGRTEHHFVQAVTFDLTGRQPMRLRTRQLSIEGLDVVVA